ncbi:hypothetical protein V2I01_31095 [Micromonospora sp. BRA006-A]|nr:hypothetical protein [Micromonospora sp. BRA006-A]
MVPDLTADADAGPAVRALLDEGHRVPPRGGPGDRARRRHPRGARADDAVVVAADDTVAGGWQRMLTVLAGLHVHGVPVDWTAILGAPTGPPPRCPRTPSSASATGRSRRRRPPRPRRHRRGGPALLGGRGTRRRVRAGRRHAHRRGHGQLPSLRCRCSPPGAGAAATSPPWTRGATG